jgi:zinc-ribbon domain
MHCPQCGQRVSDDVRFCKHCGFALEGVREFLVPVADAAKADDSPSLLNIHVGKDPRSQRGLSQTAYLLLLALAPFLLAILQGVFGFTLVTPLLLLKAFFILLSLPALRFAYAVYEAKQELKPANKSSVNARAFSALPPAPGIPVEDFSRSGRIDTARMVPPASVTENTTKLLRDSRDLG